MFLQDPFVGGSEARMYKTGDLARYLPDGNLLYLGRNDYQVKVRGFRIELGEIEAQLTDHPSVSEAAVVAVGEGKLKTQLVAYVIAKSAEQLRESAAGVQSCDISRIALAPRSHLATRLPEYMIPAAFVRMEALPLTFNGKLDRRALHTPGDEAFARQAYEAPQGEIETALAAIWIELFKVDRVGRYDGFFMLGDQSLMAVRMISRIRSILGLETSLRTLFEAPTIAELAPRLVESGTTQVESFHVLLPIRPQGIRPPLFCVHHGSGLAWCFIGLSTRLPLDQPLYGLQARGFFEEGELPSTLDEMAFDYIYQIRRVQPHGPYHLLGYSIGGLVAHTMATHLEKQGEKVALVALMDTPADYHTRALGPFGKSQEESDLVQILIGSKEGVIPALATPFSEKALRIGENNRRLAKAQAPLIFSGDLLIFRATARQENVGRLISPDSWRQYCHVEIEMYDIHCKHNDMVKPEPISEIGRILAQKLDECYSHGE
ncbi:hypothetical protein BGX26_002891 [Mortierella sp. AD094]|nr:hypothetical protein BGX26_002891 [Mortierella sp. AD094]